MRPRVQYECANGMDNPNSVTSKAAIPILCIRHVIGGSSGGKDAWIAARASGGRRVSSLRDRGKASAHLPAGLGKASVGIRPAVGQKAPCLPQGANARQVALGQKNLLADAALDQHLACRVRDERAAPKRDGILAADAVERGDEN